jgi:hypothetical protein
VSVVSDEELMTPSQELIPDLLEGLAEHIFIIESENERNGKS